MPLHRILRSSKPGTCNGLCALSIFFNTCLCRPSSTIAIRLDYYERLVNCNVTTLRPVVHHSSAASLLSLGRFTDLPETKRENHYINVRDTLLFSRLNFIEELTREEDLKS